MRSPMRALGSLLGSDPERLIQHLRRRCEELLKPDERVRQVIGAVVGISPSTMWGVFWFSPAALVVQKDHRLLCVTDRTIVVMHADRHWWPKHVITVLPRNIEFGPMSRGKWSTLWGLGGGLYVHEMFYDEAAAADADLTSDN